MPLIDWQEPLADIAYESLKKYRFFLNACTTGSGKTYVCCETMARLKAPTLVVAPKAALTQWRRVAEDFGVGQYLLDVINPEQISKPSGCQWYSRDELWKIPENTTVVFDEIHRGASGIYKTPKAGAKTKSVTTRAVAELKAFPGARLHAMSATPACDPLHMQALGYWVGMHNFNESSFHNWCRKMGCNNVRIAGRNKLVFTTNKKDSTRFMREIRQQFGDRFLALGPEDIPGFPEQTLATKLLDLNKRDRAEINAAYAAMSERMKKDPTCDMAKNNKERERIEFVMAEALAEQAANLMEDGNSVVQFFNFTEPRERFTEALRKISKTGISEIYGCQKSDRQEQIDLFQANINHIVVVNVEAGGAALSLHDENHERMRVSLLIPSHNAASMKQAPGRIRRVGGTHSIVYYVMAAGTIQERVKRSLDRKLSNIDALNMADLLPT